MNIGYGFMLGEIILIFRQGSFGIQNMYSVMAWGQSWTLKYDLDSVKALWKLEVSPRVW